MRNSKLESLKEENGVLREILRFMKFDDVLTLRNRIRCSPTTEWTGKALWLLDKVLEEKNNVQT